MQVKDRAVCAQKELFMGKVTNKDIAERAGVSAAAVSLAIHGRKGISEATRANIHKIVQEMNYAPPSRSCTDSRAVVLIPGTGLRMPPPALLQGIADFAAQQRAQLHILTLQQLMEDFPAKLTGCMLLMGVKDQMHKIDRSTLPEWVLLVVWSTGCILTLLIAPGWLNDYLAPLAAKAANTLLPVGYVALIVEMFRAQRVYLQTEEQ